MNPDKRTLDELRIDRTATPKSERSGRLVLIALAVLAAGVGLIWWLNRPKAAVVRTIAAQETAAG